MRKQLRNFILTVVPILVILHVFIGWQLLPPMDLSHAGLMIGILLLVISSVVMPLSMLARHVIKTQGTAEIGRAHV